MMTHTQSLDLANAQDVLDTMLDGPAYRWRCSCGKRGPWCSHVRPARNGGARHVAAMERR